MTRWVDVHMEADCELVLCCTASVLHVRVCSLQPVSSDAECDPAAFNADFPANLNLKYGSSNVSPRVSRAVLGGGPTCNVSISSSIKDGIGVHGTKLCKWTDVSVN